MTEIVAAVSTVVGIGLQLKDSIERVRYNREVHRVTIDRISDSLRRLKVEARKISTKASPSLLKSIARLKTELEHALEKCQKAPLNKNTSGFRQWFQRDTIESVLKDVEKQISNCFQEFTALTAIRIERKIGDHNAQVNRKLDELLRRNNSSHTQLLARPRSSTPNIMRGRPTGQGRAGTPTPRGRFVGRAETSTDGVRAGSLDLPRPNKLVKPPMSVSTSTRGSSTEDLTFNVNFPTQSFQGNGLRRKPPPVVRSDTTTTSITSASSVSSTSPLFPPSLGSTPTVVAGMTRGTENRTHARARSHPILIQHPGNGTPRTGAIPIPPSPTSPTFPPSSPTLSPPSPNIPALIFPIPNWEHANLFSQANDYDTECRRLRSLKHPNEALIAARNAVNLRRSILSKDRNSRNVTALARSLRYVGRCLKDLYDDSKADPTGMKKKGGHHGTERVGKELTKTWSECAELYKEAFREDKSLREELATALYNLSVKLSEPTASRSLGGNSYHPMTSMTSLNNRDTALSRNQAHNLDLETALDAAEESVHHFTVLERDEPEVYSMDLANAQLNLSFILSDLGRGDKALAIARKAVILAYRLTSADPHTQERVRIMRTLHKSLMRVSYCLRDLGKNEEADEAEMEAKDALKKPFLVLGS